MRRWRRWRRLPMQHLCGKVLHRCRRGDIVCHRSCRRNLFCGVPLSRVRAVPGQRHSVLAVLPVCRALHALQSPRHPRSPRRVADSVEFVQIIV